MALVATAAAQCERGPTTSTVTIPEFLAVYYAEFRSFSEDDAAEFYGGVCVTAVGGEWTVIAESVRLEGLSGDIRLEAPSPMLYLAEWRIGGDLLRADTTGLTLVNAEVDGPDASGFATGLSVDLLTGEMTLLDMELAGTAFAVRGDMAVLEGNSLRVEGAGLTTCIGLEEAPYEVTGEVARVDLAGREVRLEAGRLRLGRVTIPLREELVVSEAAFADFELPVRVTFVPGGPARLGAGLDIRIVGIPAAPGVDLVLGGTGLDAEHVAQGVALLEFEGDVPEAVGVTEVRGTAGVMANSPYLELELVREVAPWLQAEFGVRSGAQPARASVHEGSARLTAGTSVPLLGPGSGLSAALSAEAFAAITAVTPSATAASARVAGPRLGVAAAATTTWRATSVSTFSLQARSEATYYPRTWGTAAPTDDGRLQWGVRLAPAWRYASGPVNLSVSYEARFTNGASPFGTDIDRLEPRQRLQGSFRIAGGLAETASGELSGAFGLQAVYDPLVTTTPAGLKRLTFEGSLEYAALPWRLAAAARTEVSGLIDDEGRDPYAELELTATRTGWPVLDPNAPTPHVPHGTLHLGLLTNYSLVPGEEGLEALELSAAVPFAFESAELRPYVALDFAPTLNEGRLPWWSGYGLDVTFITCCGSFTASLLNARGSWSAGIGIDLERRPLRAGEGDVEDGGVGIMPGDR